MRFLKFWGTRGSCPVSGPQFARYGGNTVCLEVRYDNSCFIIDAGTGIRPLGETFKHRSHEEIQIFLSHPHLDHLIGLPFFEPAFDPNVQLAIWLPSTTAKNGKHLLTQFLSTDLFPGGLDQVKAQLRFHPAFEDNVLPFGDVVLHCCQVCHPGITFGFKIVTPHQTIGYVTDHEFLKGNMAPLDKISASLLAKDKKVIHFLRDVDILIHEAQYFDEEYPQKVGWGHSSLSNAVALIRETHVKKWLVVHHNPSHTDADLDRAAAMTRQLLQQAKLSCDVQWIGDGHVLTL